MWHSRGERDKTGKLSSGDKSLSAHPASIRAPAAADVKWIQHFLSHYPISLQYSASSTFKSAGQSTHTPLPPSPWSDAIFSSWLFGKVHCFFSGSLGLALFDLTVLNHFTCFVFLHFTNWHVCTAPATVVVCFTVLYKALASLQNNPNNDWHTRSQKGSRKVKKARKIQRHRPLVLGSLTAPV